MTEAIALSVVHSMIALLIVGAFLFPLFADPRTEAKSLTTRMLLGAIFSMSNAALVLTGIVIEDQMFIDASAGPLVFSGYLGGPIAGAMTLATSLALRSWYGGDFLAAGILVQTSCMLAGLALRTILPVTDWSKLPRGILALSVTAFLVVQTTAIAIALPLGLAPDPPLVARYVGIFYLVGSLSVACTWFVVLQGWRVAALVRERNVLLQQLQLVFETCGIGAFRYNGQTGTLEFDRSFVKLYGAESTRGFRPGDFADRQVHADDRAAMQAFIREAITGDRTEGSHLFRAYRADGELHDMRSAWKLDSRTPDGKRNIIGLHVDVTDVVAARNAQTRALEHVKAIAENAPGGIYEAVWENGSPRELLYVSPKCAAMWGLTTEDIQQAPCAMASRSQPEAFAQSMEVTRTAIATGQPGTARLWMPTPEEQPRWIDFRVQAVAKADGTHHVYGIFVDVTKEVAALEEARRQSDLAHQAQKRESIGQLTGGVAHDFNNILAVIMGNLELLREEIHDDKQREMIDAGLMASRRGASLTRNLLAFARRARLRPEVLDLNTVVRHSKNWMARALPASVEIETALLAGLWPVRLDAASLESALLNLILNARDAMQGHGKLTIATANMHIDKAHIDTREEEISPGRYVMLAVTDTGSGMDERTLSRMFEPFFTTKPPGAGSGVGLSMVHGFVRQSGGTVQVYSELGHGTSVKLYFPLAQDSDGAAARETAVTPPAAGGRVLLVEDDDNVREVLKTMLGGEGYDVVVARNGDEALERFDTDPEFDVILTDIVMPGKLQGTQLAGVVRETRPEVPFIFMSGYAAEATVHGNGLRPEDIRLMKPVPKSDLLAAIAQALGHNAQS